MAKTKISEYDSTAANNTDINSINIDEGCSPSGINNAIRALMSHLKNWQGGTSGDALPVASGGTGSTTAGAARTALSVAGSGANSDITSITGLTTPLTIAQGGTGTSSTTHTNLTTNVTGTLPVANGGTGANTITSKGVVIGNGTSAVTTISPSTTGNVLTSNGTDWVSTAPTSAGGQLLGTITLSGTGNTFSLGSLNLTSYKNIYGILNGVSSTVTGTGASASISNATGSQLASNTIKVNSSTTQYYIYGSFRIDLITGIITFDGTHKNSAILNYSSAQTLPLALGAVTTLTDSATFGVTAIGTATTTIYFYVSDAGTKSGTISFYGNA